MWMVPISICTSDDPTCAKMQILMDKSELTLVLKDIKPDQWVKVSCHKGEHITGNKFDCHCNVPLHFIFLFSFFFFSSLQSCISYAEPSLCCC